MRHLGLVKKTAASGGLHDPDKGRPLVSGSAASSISLYWLTSVTVGLLTGRCHLSFPGSGIISVMKTRQDESLNHNMIMEDFFSAQVPYYFIIKDLNIKDVPALPKKDRTILNGSQKKSLDLLYFDFLFDFSPDSSSSYFNHVRFWWLSNSNRERTKPGSDHLIRWLPPATVCGSSCGSSSSTILSAVALEQLNIQGQVVKKWIKGPRLNFVLSCPHNSS